MVASFALRGLCRARAAFRCDLAELLWVPRRGHRLTPADDELYQRTRISLLQRESPQSMYIDSYSSLGFMVNGNRVLGPCALLPHSVVQWNVSSEEVEVGTHQDITEESFSLFWLLEPRIEIIVVGTGDRTERLQPRVLQAMRQRGIAVEVQDTPNACATFNFLCHEGRVTGAALIPPPGGTVLTTLAQAAE
ncbi:NADH dehydrogenase [ubiquinone] 1 alpha subcomplex assembly factor 3 isoform X1 [Panthera pardus]|uniref:NADH dehydrogenase [ubiquinone] 1 alpha subcomplex assembly factor 3 n=2 Tax=Panthera TaxID=9688 RepID=A0A9V1E1R8_PANPR|nr:NADH dehydrogenase [ubiquinone] 1 alpha subcomplex assembly factor 3 isoform X1 [Panthera pardus]XP_042785254.1 NADH dehydrogenase [ubiquinone] 1 alpha subcomplex assembly factor 3 isoform X1 [Panthera leo]XP_042834833.1 NADH dehydrogenase [ubiquinone] 1 alpha subcomplex assembly factor 3 isoform X1 [Panthera tigris]XP_049496370.1 NADH dehydrogenase [ubiquinone] 1 alpha subcomplex assembly factor 3 isoform X1 [Panthera uncia]XP_060489662.1 NADH dehydrogenase [ubiquinone] 1 alpha subcomplex a